MKPMRMLDRLRGDNQDGVTRPDLAWRQSAFDRFSAATAMPMLILTILMVPVLVAPYAVHHLDQGTRSFLDAAGYFIWAVFLFEYLIKVTLAPRRWHFVSHHPFDLIIVVVPMLRPLSILRSVRVVRALRLSRLGALAGEGTQTSKRSLGARATNYVLVVVGALILTCSVVVLDLERGAKGSNIKSLGDAVWWAITTVATVGYGDRVPVTPGGRAVAAVLMLSGIGLLGIITAAIASYFVQQAPGKGSDQNAEVLARLEAIETMLARLAASQESSPTITTDESRAMSPMRAPNGGADRVQEALQDAARLTGFPAIGSPQR
jgi:voltage-gated potassium channel